MTDTTSTGPILPEEIEDEADGVSARLSREADAILADDAARTLGLRPIHTAVREDAVAVRDWGRARVGRLRQAVADEPVRATLYALGLGVVIGLLAAR